MKVLSNILSTLDFPNEFYTVEYHLGRKENFLYMAHLKLQKGEVELLGDGRFTDVDQLSGATGNLPVMLLVTGTGVLSKKIATSRNPVERSEIIDRAFPGINQEDLLVDMTILENDECAVSAMRKSKMMELLREWPGHLPVLDLNLGIYLMWPLFAELGPANLRLGFHRLDIKEGRATAEPEEESDDVQVFGQNISASVAIPFVLGLLKCNEKSFSTMMLEVTQKREDWKYTTLYKKGLVFGACGLFLMLLSSFMFFSYYSGKVSEMAIMAQSYSRQNLEIDQMKKSYDEKRQFLLVNGSQNSRMSKMADDVAILIPEQIVLTRMVFHPVLKMLKREKLVRFSRNELLISGETKGYSHFQKWLGGLKNLEWSDGLDIIGYEESGTLHEANFTIAVKLKE